jgi:cobalamin biosynthesis Co2+ chelatase CbiK
MTVLEFTQQEIEEKLNIVELDDMVFTCNHIEVLNNSGYKTFVLQGSCIMEGEKYPDFTIEVELETEIKDITCQNIMTTDWIEYDLLF